MRSWRGGKGELDLARSAKLTSPPPQAIHDKISKKSMEELKRSNVKRRFKADSDSEDERPRGRVARRRVAKAAVVSLVCFLSVSVSLDSFLFANDANDF